jgi:hypothetical protein
VEKIDDEIYCEFHGCIHAENNDPYGYEFNLNGDPPECGPQVWRKIWAGGYIETWKGGYDE